ncbi:Lsr2 protein [Arthrobacter sp. ok909]|uniref:histone-like nucleoid-structuring protein Lsr2 n=1 Tax=Arthrobacter sp. ok909 TaxID=1761746 RepID=UPI0008903D8B|nr:Lsr2 family protein [Arthrobacter sp. ok909]SDP33471.1 Lsr2 protein [Arthrobacter sp. ok909]
MAQRVVTLLEDDFDGSKASETISFALDGVEYAIDLNDAHASELREAFSRYTKAARKTGGRTRTVRPRESDARVVRLWAIEQGLQVNTRGRIQADIMEKYAAAH